MPDKKTIQRARSDRRHGKAPGTQAGEFVREEIRHIRAGRHGARSTSQAIAIGLSKARRAGVAIPERSKAKLDDAGKSAAQPSTRKAPGARKSSKSTATRRRAALRALKQEGSQAALKGALSRHTHQAASGHTATERSAAAKRAAKTKGAAGRSAAARKAARTRARSCA